MDHVPTAGRPRATETVIIPRGVITAAGVLLLFTIALAGAARFTGNNHVALPPTAVVSSRDLTFTDQPDGGILIDDVATGRRVALIAPATGGFLRGIMRGLVREHRLNDLAAGSSFRLTRWADGRLSIEDPATAERFELEAFGPTNEAAFARLLEGAPGPAAEGPAGQDRPIARQAAAVGTER